MTRSFTLTLFVFAVFVLSVGSAMAQWQPPDYTSPNYGVSQPEARGYTPGQNQYDQSLNDRSYQDPGMSSGAEYWWPTPEQQMQSDSLAIQEYEAGYGTQRNRRRSTCNSWTLEGC